MEVYGFLNKKAGKTKESNDQSGMAEVMKYLRITYIHKYGDFLPPTNKLDQVLDDTDNTESMVNQVLFRSLIHQQGCDKASLPSGPEVQITEMFGFIARKKWLTA